MLENEPTTPENNSASDSTGQSDPPPTTPARRRRTTKTAAAVAVTPAAEPDGTAAASAATAAPRRRAAAKKTAATAPDTEPAASTAAQAATKRSARGAKTAKTATTVAAEPAPAAELVDSTGGAREDAAVATSTRTRRRSASGPQPQVDPASTPIAGELPARVATPPRIPTVLFQAPTEPVVAATRARRGRPVAADLATDDAHPAAADVAVSDSGGTFDDSTGPADGAGEREGTGPRRRRRGGRGRRGGREDGLGATSTGGAPATDRAPFDGQPASEQSDQSDDEGTPTAAAGRPEADDGDDEFGREGSASSRRRRRRRRRAAGADSELEEHAPDDPPNTVVRVRAPREHDDTDVQGVKGVKGSTRLEAKKQRRREGREQGRGGRRGTVITESEFLARRESVDRVMVVRQRGDRTQIGVLEDGVLVEHFVSTAATQRMVGNVYLGRVQNVLSGMEAAFVDIGKGRNAVLYAGEVNFDTSGLEGQPRRIESALKAGQPVLVQVTKDSIGHKGARLTSQISLPGRYLVYVPEGSMMGISRKLPDVERGRLKAILKKITPEGGGVIVRTAAEGASEEELTADVARLAAQWEDIKKKSENTTNAPVLLYGEPDLTVRVIRDVFNEDFNALVVQADSEWDIVENYVGQVAPDLVPRLSHWTSEQDIFTHYRLDEQLAKALDRKVWLPSGGYLVIDRTEAMIVIDVNTGRFVGKGGNLEETVTKNNLEAAEEIVRQLRLRDIGGIIVIDFIDMVLESNRDLVLRRLVECLGRDRTKHQVAEVTSLGLVQMTRKRVGNGLLEAFSETCEHCNGRGVIVHTDLVEHKPGRDDDSGANHSGGAGRGRGQARGLARVPATPKPAPPPPRAPGDPVVPIPMGELAAPIVPGPVAGEPAPTAETVVEAAAVTPPVVPVFAPSANAWTNLAEVEPVAVTAAPDAVQATESQAGDGQVDEVSEAPAGEAPAAGTGRSRRGGRRRGPAKVGAAADSGSAGGSDSGNS
jgi:ribonuclease E